MTLHEKLIGIQNEIKAPKSQYNDFGKYNYRSCEDICTALKPLCDKYKVSVTIGDQITQIGDRFYINAVVTMTDAENPDSVIIGSAYAREDVTKKGMDSAQITGSASSYARKYALAGLFLLDDTVDSDGLDPQKKETKQKEYKCVDCGAEFTEFESNGKKYSAEQAYHMAEKRSDDGKARCKACRGKFKNGGNQ